MKRLMDEICEYDAWHKRGRDLPGPDPLSIRIIDQLGGWDRMDRLGISRDYVLSHPQPPRGWLLWQPEDVPMEARVGYNAGGADGISVDRNSQGEPVARARPNQESDDSSSEENARVPAYVEDKNQEGRKWAMAFLEQKMKAKHNTQLERRTPFVFRGRTEDQEKYDEVMKQIAIREEINELMEENAPGIDEAMEEEKRQGGVCPAKQHARNRVRL